jgi:hypothetical protein
LTAEQQAVADAAAARQDGSGAAANATNGAVLVAAGLLPGNMATGAGNATGALGLNGIRSVAGNGNVLSGSSRLRVADNGGPSCRPAELLDLRSGVVNYGC